MERKSPQESFDNRKWRKPDILNFKVICVQRDFMMNMEALFSHAYLHREPSAPCQCITCSSELSPGQQECVWVCGVCACVCARMCVYIGGIRRGYGFDGRGSHWGPRGAAWWEEQMKRDADWKEFVRRTLPSAGLNESCSWIYALVDHKEPGPRPN